jgi:DNA-damage-inducible protein J
MKTANYNIRLDPNIKAQAEELFEGFGLNLSDAINVFLHTSIKFHGFPFEVRNPRPKKELLEAIAETEQMINEYENGTRKPQGFATARELMKYLMSEDEQEDAI